MMKAERSMWGWIAQFGPLANGAHPAVGRASVEALSVVAAQDRALGALTDGQVDGPGHPGDQRDQSWFVSLADDVKSPVPPIDAKILDVGSTGLAHPEAVEAQKNPLACLGKTFDRASTKRTFRTLWLDAASCWTERSRPTSLMLPSTWVLLI
jgi:hypothetical protein